MVALLDDPSVMFVVNDQCETGMTVVDRFGETKPARKESGWCTNSVEIARELDAFQCRNRIPGDKRPRHDHCILLDGRAKGCEEYTALLVTAVLRVQAPTCCRWHLVNKFI